MALSTLRLFGRLGLSRPAGMAVRTVSFRLLSSGHEVAHLKQLLESKNDVIRSKEDFIKQREDAVATLIREKDVRIDEKEMRIEQLTHEVALTVAKYCAVLHNRVLLDLGLRVGYPKLRTFTKRYEAFLEDDVLSQKRLPSGDLSPKRLSSAALEVIQHVLETHGIDQADLEKELSSFLHNASKPLHYLHGEQPCKRAVLRWRATNDGRNRPLGSTIAAAGLPL